MVKAFPIPLLVKPNAVSEYRNAGPEDHSPSLRVVQIVEEILAHHD
jgi:hypothetical protein